MTWSAALPEAALRALRTAAGQRALQMTLLMGGLLAIGLLRGERAYAESGTGALPEGRAGQVVSGASETFCRTSLAWPQEPHLYA